MTDTIYALSSGRPPAAIAVIRLSGPNALAVATAMAGTLPTARRAGLRALRDPGGALLDRALVLVFPAPHSATGDDLVELHCHGGRGVVAAVERVLAAHQLRLAEPGEFTRRALRNGCIDLAQAEGLADLLQAETERERRAALDATEGRVGALIGGWLQRLIAMSAAVEASLDFGDEDDVPDEARLAERIAAEARRLSAEMTTVLSSPSVERLRDGIRVVIGGPPNAGKSTLLNRMADREAAIVSPVSGTTRDRIDASVVRGGEAYVLTDTAGLTTTNDPVEAIGVDRAREAIGGADILLWLGEEAPPPSRHRIWVQARGDLPDRQAPRPGRDVVVRSDNDSSIDVLWDLVAGVAGTLLGSGSAPVLRDRYRSTCRQAVEILSGIATRDPVLMADDLRHAASHLATLTGQDATELMLDDLFGRFCIGK